LRIFVFVEIGDQHVGALARKRDRNRAADAAIAARDDRRFTGKPSTACVTFFSVVGTRLHGRRRSRDALLLL